MRSPSMVILYRILEHCCFQRIICLNSGGEQRTSHGRVLPADGTCMIDVHAHHWPDGLLRAVAQGKNWFGWEGATLSDGRTVLALGDRLVRFAPPATDLADLSARLDRRHLEHGIVSELTMPVGFLWGDQLGEMDSERYYPELNSEMAQAQAAQPYRIRGAAMLPFHAPRLFERELERAIADGLTVAAVPSNIRGQNLDDHTVLPLIEMILDSGLAVALHPTYLTPAGADRFPRYYFANSFGAPLEAALALMSLVHAGLFDRRPQARVLAVNGAGCTPYEIGRFAGRYAERADVRSMDRSPETYLPDAHYDCMVLDGRSLQLLVDRVGADRVMIGTDFPFRTDVPGGAAAWIHAQQWLSGEQKEQILWKTAVAFLQLDPEGWAAAVPRQQVRT